MTHYPSGLYPVASYIREECEAKAWGREQFAEAVADAGAEPDSRDLWDLSEPLTEGECRVLARVFGTSPQYWAALDAAWWGNLERRLEAGQ